MKRWKLSPTDLESITRWEEYSRAKDDMFAATDIEESPWWTIESDDKRASRLNTISHLLSQIPYERLDLESVEIPDRPSATTTSGLRASSSGTSPTSPRSWARRASSRSSLTQRGEEPPDIARHLFGALQGGEVPGGRELAPVHDVVVVAVCE